jgi:hypothetical protein
MVAVVAFNRTGPSFEVELNGRESGLEREWERDEDGEKKP